MPPLSITEAQLDRMMDVLHRCTREATEGVDAAEGVDRGGGR